MRLLIKQRGSHPRALEVKYKQCRAGWQPHSVMGRPALAMLLCPSVVLPLTAWLRWLPSHLKCQPTREAKAVGGLACSSKA